MLERVRPEMASELDHACLEDRSFFDFFIQRVTVSE